MKKNVSCPGRFGDVNVGDSCETTSQADVSGQGDVELGKNGETDAEMIGGDENPNHGSIYVAEPLELLTMSYRDDIDLRNLMGVLPDPGSVLIDTAALQSIPVMFHYQQSRIKHRALTDGE
ncbi:MAG: hypothetical protein Q9169_003015 [Polycauliona sp. 2 TL-2023]